MTMTSEAPDGCGLRRGIIRRLGAAAVFVAAGLAPAGAQSDQPPADQGTAEQRQACTPDVFRLCRAEIPSRTRIVACLTRQISALSPACRKVFEDRQQAEAPASAARKTARPAARAKARSKGRTATRSARTR